jgi:hypothetical protein
LHEIVHDVTEYNLHVGLVAASNHANLQAGVVTGDVANPIGREGYISLGVAKYQPSSHSEISVAECISVGG